MNYKRKLTWCWVKHAGRNVAHYYQLLRWWWRGETTPKPWDFRALSYSFDQLKVTMEAWLKRRGKA